MGHTWNSTLVGRTFNRLTVIEQAPSGIDKQRRWKCLCECGGETTVASRDLTTGHSKSCGCLKKELTAQRRTIHGGKGTRPYRIWLGMKARCYRKKTTQFKDYGGRGIKVCDEWLNDFGQFIADMGEPPEGMSIDRIDNDGDYTPDNCRWATDLEQANNKRDTRYVEFNGEKISMANLARKTGAHYEKARHKIVNQEWPVEDAIRYAGGTI